MGCTISANANKNFSVNYSDILKEVLTKEGVLSTCYSKFHNFSINNQFLAYWQLKCRNMPISPIASKTTWGKLNRKINVGAKALWLWMPKGSYKYEKIDEVTGEKYTVSGCTGFEYVNRWYSLEMTNGQDIKETNDKINLSYNFEKAYKILGVKLVDFEKVNGNIQGYANPEQKTLALNPLANHVEMTIWHELAHIVLEHHKAQYTRELKELEAESVAYIIGTILGIDETQKANSRGYIQDWFKSDDNKIPEENAKNIMRVAQKILKAGL